MDPTFDFDFLVRRPIPVKSTEHRNEFDFDEGLIDRVLGTPNKIVIPERYIPEREALLPEEEEKRERKAEAICRLLSKSNCAGPLPLVLPHPSPKRSSGSGSNVVGKGSSPSVTSRYVPQQKQRLGQTSAAESLGVTNLYHQNQGLSSSPNISQSSRLNRPILQTAAIKKASSSSRLERNSSATRSSASCDWSLAGVRTSPHPSTSSLVHRSPSPSASSSYYHHRSASSLYGPSIAGTPHHYNSMSNSNLDIGGGSSGKTINHSYHSSYSSTSSGRSSSDREEMLHLQQNLAREVTDRTRLVAIRALGSSPSPVTTPYREPSPPSPVELPTVQQREIFFT